MSKIKLLALFAIAVGLAGCGSGTHEFTSPTDVQREVNPGTAVTLELERGYALTIPANTFENTTVVLFSNRLFNELTTTYFPTPGKQIGDLISGVVINTPADVLLHANMPLTFGLNDDAGAAAGTQLLVYRYDRFSGEWNPWAGLVATVDASGTTASTTLPTADFRGFIGSMALFRGMTAASLPVGATTYIQGVVVDGAGQPIATDVGVSVIVGAVKYPSAVTNGRVPTGGTLANTVDSAADGSFTVQIPANLVGQPVNLEFGREDTEFSAQDNFELLAPATPRASTNFLIVRFGINNVRSLPVGRGGD